MREATDSSESDREMPHTPLIATVVAGICLAFVLGTLANRLRLSPLVGYLAAGILIGPFTPGFVADQALARQLAELGVILLMFGIGLHFSLDNLLSVKAIALPGAFGQIALVTVLGLTLTQAIGWPIGTGVVFGLALSVASTVVVLRNLQEKRLLETERGRIAVGWLIVQDLAMIFALVLLPAFAHALGKDINGTKTGESGLFAFLAPYTFLGALGLTLVKLATFIAVMMVVGRRVIPWVLHYVAHTGSRELFRLAFHVTVDMDFDHLIGSQEAVADALLEGIGVNRIAEIFDIGDVFGFLRRGGEADLRRA